MAQRKKPTQFAISQIYDEAEQIKTRLQDNISSLQSHINLETAAIGEYVIAINKIYTVIMLSIDTTILNYAFTLFGAAAQDFFDMCTATILRLKLIKQEQLICIIGDDLLRSERAQLTIAVSANISTLYAHQLRVSHLIVFVYLRIVLLIVKMITGH